MINGLERTYRVERVDGESRPGGRYEHSIYFVLDMDDPNTPAIMAFADSLKRESPIREVDHEQTTRR